MLTPREQELVELLVSEGYSNAELGRVLGLNLQTVKRHMTSILDKTGYGSRLELVVRTLQQRLAEATDKNTNPTI